MLGGANKHPIAAVTIPSVNSDLAMASKWVGCLTSVEFVEILTAWEPRRDILIFIFRLNKGGWDLARGPPTPFSVVKIIKENYNSQQNFGFYCNFLLNSVTVIVL